MGKDLNFELKIYNNRTLGMVITGLVFHGLGIAAVLVSSFTDALKTAV